jgi:hypothetical protein
LGVALALSLSFPAPGSDGILVVVSDASGDVAGGDVGAGGYAFHPAFPSSVFIASAPWSPDVALALLEAALPIAQRTGRPQLSMPAAELFPAWATAAAATAAFAPPHHLVQAVIAVGDCDPA